MRWPWTRPEASDAPTSGAPAAPPLGPLTEAPRRDWAALPATPSAFPAIQRAIDVDRFTAGAFTSWRDPSVVQPLSHAVDPEAALGLAGGITTVVPPLMPAGGAAVGPADVAAPRPTGPTTTTQLRTFPHPPTAQRTIVASGPAPLAPAPASVAESSAPASAEVVAPPDAPSLGTEPPAGPTMPEVDPASAPVAPGAAFTAPSAEAGPGSLGSAVPPGPEPSVPPPSSAESPSVSVEPDGPADATVQRAVAGPALSDAPVPPEREAPLLGAPEGPTSPSAPSSAPTTGQVAASPRSGSASVPVQRRAGLGAPLDRHPTTSTLPTPSGFGQAGPVVASPSAGAADGPDLHPGAGPVAASAAEPVLQRESAEPLSRTDGPRPSDEPAEAPIGDRSSAPLLGAVPVAPPPASAAPRPVVGPGGPDLAPPASSRPVAQRTAEGSSGGSSVGAPPVTHRASVGPIAASPGPSAPPPAPAAVPTLGGDRLGAVTPGATLPTADVLAARVAASPDAEHEPVVVGAGRPVMAARVADRQLVGASPIQRRIADPAAPPTGAVAPGPSADTAPTAPLAGAGWSTRSGSADPSIVTPLQRSADPVAAGLAQRAADGSVVFDQAVRAQLLSGTTVTVGAGGSEESGESGGDRPVQRSALGAPPPPPPAEVAITAPVVQPELGNPPLGPATRPQGGGPADLDELAKQLYGRIRTQLAAELRIDRERAGLSVGSER